MNLQWDLDRGSGVCAFLEFPSLPMQLEVYWQIKVDAELIQLFGRNHKMHQQRSLKNGDEDNTNIHNELSELSRQQKESKMLVM